MTQTHRDELRRGLGAGVGRVPRADRRRVARRVGVARAGAQHVQRAQHALPVRRGLPFHHFAHHEARQARRELLARGAQAGVCATGRPTSWNGQEYGNHRQQVGKRNRAKCTARGHARSRNGGTSGNVLMLIVVGILPPSVSLPNSIDRTRDLREPIKITALRVMVFGRCKQPRGA